MKLYNYLLVPVALCFQFASANVEKIIFKGPAPLSIHSEGPSLQNLQLLTINPTNATLRTPIQPIWASEEFPAGTTSWFIMHNLTEGQRYELRLCWAATQPTDFKLKWFTVEEVFNNATLLTTLADYAESRQIEGTYIGNNIVPAASSSPVSGTQSLAFLRVTAAADYYSANKTLMENVRPVLVDIILDPYILNVYPSSLLPTAAWIVSVAVASFFIAQFVSKWLQIVASTPEETKKDI